MARFRSTPTDDRSLCLARSRGLLYNLQRPTSCGRSRRINFDQAIVEQGLRLTAIGLGTAFALLLVIGVLISIIGRLCTFMSPGLERQGPQEETTAPSSINRDKALAAVAAVTTLRARGRRHIPTSDRS